MVTMT